jgi:predicted nicotinamide N-methyase
VWHARQPLAENPVEMELGDITGESAMQGMQERRTLWERITDWRSGHARPASGEEICPSRWHELRAAIEATGPLRVVGVNVPGVGSTLRITRPYPVITDDHRNVPYWSEIWPSGVVLAGVIAREPYALQGRRVLELGPGVGVTAMCALQAGADLVLADSESGSLLFSAFNCLDQASLEPTTVRVNWRRPSATFFELAGKGFSLVLAADALYEDEDVKPFKALVERIVAPGGELWLAEPGRDPAERFVKLMRKRGWNGIDEQYDSQWPDPHDHALDVVNVYRLRHPSPSL